jgi:Winged helix DNA-binding domain
VRTFSSEERRTRLARRHFLAPGSRADGAVQLAGGMVGLHATDPATVYLAARARGLADQELDRALYEERTLLRMIGMRRTLFVFPLDLATVVQAACTVSIAAAQRVRYAKEIEKGGIAKDGLRWLARAEAATLKALQSRGQAFATELSSDVPQLRKRVHYGEGKTWAGSTSMTSWVLFMLAAEGRIVRGPPRGTWTSSQWSWAPAESWFKEPLARLEPEHARAELASRWLKAFGPAGADDLKWWTGWSLTQTRAALAAIDAVEVDLDARSGFIAPDDDEIEPDVEPWAALLPALDPTVMGWKERDWYLGEHRPALFDRAGNAGPTVWWNGRIVGGWSVRKDGEIPFRLLEDVGSDAETAIEAEAARLGAWLGEVKVLPRFATPLAKELSG